MNAVGLNWSEIKDRKIKKLQDKVDKYYRENQRMKRRLVKYEKTRAMVNYYNKKGKDEDNNSRSTRDREDYHIINPS